MSCKTVIKQRQENRNVLLQSPVLAVSAAASKSRAKENHGNSLGIQEVMRRTPSTLLQATVHFWLIRPQADMYDTPHLT